VENYVETVGNPVEKERGDAFFVGGFANPPTPPNLLGQGNVWYEWNVSAPLYSGGQKSPLQGGAALSKKDTDPFLI
jgi:hypothetical protein